MKKLFTGLILAGQLCVIGGNSLAADVAISALPSASGITGTDTTVIVQGGITKKATISLLPAPATLATPRSIYGSNFDGSAALAGPVGAAYGGTGVANNAASTITVTGAYPLALTLSGSTALTAPTSGTILTTANAPTFSTKATGGINYWDATAAPGNVANAVVTGPVCGNGTSAPAVCSLSGNTAVVMTKGTGALVSGNCAKFDASGNVIDSGGACGGGSMTYPTGTGIAVVSAGASWGTTIAPGTGVATALAVNTNTAGAFSVLIAKGTAVINPGALTSGSCSSAIDGGTATGVATTDTIDYSFSADLTATTGYSGVGTLVTLYKYPTADHVNFKVCNWTGSSITPASVTLNWRVAR